MKHVVTPDRIVAYLGPDTGVPGAPTIRGLREGILTDWHGTELGTYRITRTWRTPRSYVSSTMHQVYATVDGVTYTGRSAGVGMIFKGKVIKT